MPMLEIPPEQLAQMTPAQRAHAELVIQLMTELDDRLKAAGATNDAVLDTLHNLYMNRAFQFGRQVECAHHMLRIWGPVLIAEQLKAGGVEVTATAMSSLSPSPNVH